MSTDLNMYQHCIINDTYIYSTIVIICECVCVICWLQLTYKLHVLNEVLYKLIVISVNILLSVWVHSTSSCAHVIFNLPPVPILIASVLYVRIMFFYKVTNFTVRIRYMYMYWLYVIYIWYRFLDGYVILTVVFSLLVAIKVGVKEEGRERRESYKIVDKWVWSDNIFFSFMATFC